MDEGRPGESRRVASTTTRGVGQDASVLLPIISLSYLAFVPAVQPYRPARTAGWLVTATLLVLTSAAAIAGAATDIDNGVLGLLVIGGTLGGHRAAGRGRSIVLGPPKEKPEVDPVVQAASASRERRQKAREIAETDPEPAMELGIGIPDVPRAYDDGGQVAESFVPEREARRGYSWLVEVGALSGVDPAMLELGAERMIVLPYRPDPG